MFCIYTVAYLTYNIELYRKKRLQYLTSGTPLDAIVLIICRL